MERRHSSFLLRCWWRNDGLERIEIEHIQSGKRELLNSVAEAVKWICSQGSDSGGSRDTARDGEEDEGVGKKAQHIID